jgi:hypothetical protein
VTTKQKMKRKEKKCKIRFDRQRTTATFSCSQGQFTLSKGHWKKTLQTVSSGCTVTGNTKGGSITVPLTSCLTGLD